jgi:hypothetical protein
MSTITLNLSQFALGLGNADRLTLEASLPFHKAYHKADAEGQAAMRTDFVTSYVQGNLKTTPEKAAKIVALTRAERNAKDEKAVNAAGKKFAYHIVRAEGSNLKEEEEIPAELLKAAKELAKLANAYKNAKSLASKAMATAFAK